MTMPGTGPATAPDPGTTGRRVLPHLLDLVFLVGVLVKGLDGLAEVVVGIPLLFITPASIASMVHAVTAEELLGDPHDFIAHLLISSTSRLQSHDLVFLGLYLLVHGAVKLAIVIALIVGAVRIYPWAIAALGALTVYQIVELVLHPSVGLVLLTLLDLIVIALTWREWRERRSLRETWAATLAWLRRGRAPRARSVDGR